MPAIRRTKARLLKSKTKALDNGVVEVIVATDRRDRHGEVLDIKGLNTKEYSGVVLWGHDYFSFPIGKSLSLRKTKDGQLISKAQLAVDEYDFAETAYNLIKGGYITDVSIGFIPKEYNPELDSWIKSEMVEYSFVSIGANPDAKITKKALEAVGLTKDQFEAQIKEHMLKMKELEDEAIAEAEEDENKDDQQAQTPDSQAEDEQDDEVQPDDSRQPEADEPIDIKPENKDNVLEHIAAMKSLLSAAEQELKGSDSEDTDDEEQPQPSKIKKRITLVRAKKTLQTVDRVAELAIGQLKNRLKEDE